MINKRVFRRAIFWLSLGLFLAAMLPFAGKREDTCLGIPFLDAEPDPSQYVYRDYSESLEFFEEKAAVDVETSTIYISQSIDGSTAVTDLKGELELRNRVNRMYFLRDPMFENLAEAVADGHGFPLIILSGKHFMRYQVVFTTLPVMRLEDPYKTELTEKFVKVTGSMCLWTPEDPDLGLYTVKKSEVRWKIRGQTASSKPKKSWKLTLLKDTGTKKNLSLLGLGADDDWILNPLYMDDTKETEQFAMTLWNELADQAEWDLKMSCGAYCEMVMNGKYRGLYLLQRRVDRKYLELDEDQILLKTNSSISVSPGEKEAYEITYSPFPAEETYDIWMDLFHNRLGDAINLNNYADVSIFIQLGSMQDNATFRNLFCVLTPGEEGYGLSYVLWDTDMSMGMCPGFTYDYDTAIHLVLQRYEHDTIRQSVPDLDQRIAERWFQLREGLLREAHMDGLLENMDAELSSSGARKRDRDEWGVRHDSLKSVAEFLHDRLIFLDNYYGEKLP